ncbi:MAG: aminopeptidase P family protein [Chloroflexota bacterium]
MNRRLSGLRRGLAAKNIDGILISQPENRHYLSGFDGSAGYLLITPKRAVLATDFRYTEQAGLQATDYRVFKIAGNAVDWFPGLVRDAGIKRLGFEAGDITVEAYRQLKNALKKKQVAVKLVPVTGLVESLRAVKEPGEVELIRKAAAITDLAFERVAPTIKAGMTERQVAWELEKYLRENGGEAVAFEIIVAAGPNSARPHARPSERVIREGEPVVIDMGARYEGYASDLTRTICVGAPNDTFKKVYATVLDAQTGAIDIIIGGMTGQRADAAAREVINRAGYGEAFGHSLGHGVGLAAHESPRLGHGSKEKLADGMVFTVEPGIYLPGWGGVRIEDTVMMENGRVVTLSKARKVRYD